MFKKLFRVRLMAFTSSMIIGSSKKSSGTVNGKMILFALLIVYVLFSVGMIFKMIFSSIAKPFTAAGLGWFYFAFCFLVSFAIMFVFSIFASKSQLYEAKDNEMLLALPLKPRDILLSRVAVLVLYNLIYQLAVIIPAAYEWWSVNPAKPLAIMIFMLLSLALSLFATAFSCFFGWLLSLLTAKMRNKTPFTVALSVLFLSAYFFFYNKLTSSMSDFAVKGTALAGKLSGITPLVWLGKAVSECNTLYFFISLVVFVLPFTAVVFILSKNFYKTVFRSASAIKIERTDNALRVSDIKRALLGRELKRLASSSNYIMNSGMGLIMELIAAVALIVMKGKIDALLAQYSDSTQFIAALIPAALCLFSSMVLFSAPSVSLEGKTMWLLRSSPLNTTDILDAKLRMHVILCAPVSLILSAACLFAFPFALKYAAYIVVLPQLFNCLNANIGLMCDLKHTNLNWLTEIQVIKQSMSVFLGMILGLTAVVIPFLPVGLLADRISPFITLTAAGVIYAVAILLTYRWIKTAGVKRFELL